MQNCDEIRKKFDYQCELIEDSINALRKRKKTYDRVKKYLERVKDVWLDFDVEDYECSEYIATKIFQYENEIEGLKNNMSIDCDKVQCLHFSFDVNKLGFLFF